MEVINSFQKNIAEKGDMMNSYSLIKKKSISIYYFLIIFLHFFNFCCLIINYNTSFKYHYVYAFFFEIILLLYIIYAFSTKNIVCIIFTLSFVAYFYQIPFLSEIANNLKFKEYSIQINFDTEVKIFTTYSFILFMYFFLIREISSFNLPKINVEGKEYLYFISAFLTFLFVIIALVRAGGIDNYISLNKFEATEAQGSYLNYKIFAIIMVTIGFHSKKRIINYLNFIFIVFLSMFEILTAKRYILAAFFILYILIRKKKLNVKDIFLFSMFYIMMVFFKLTYYNIKALFLSSGKIHDIIWFTTEEFIDSLLFNGEFIAHGVLFANIVQNQIYNEGIYWFFEMLLASIPFASWILPSSYLTAGELLRQKLNIWSGLASAPYIVPYMSLNILGIFITYLILYRYIFKIIKKMSKNFYINLLIYSNIVNLVYYYIREELIFIIKWFYVSLLAILIIYFVDKFLDVFKKNKGSDAKLDENLKIID